MFHYQYHIRYCILVTVTDISSCPQKEQIKIFNPNKSDICNMNQAQPYNMICPVITFNEFRNRLQDVHPAELLILVDENTGKHCLPELLKHVPELNDAAVFELTSGEMNKTLQHCERVWHFMSDRQFSRKTVVINLGGGVLCDMGGLIAALYKRGVDFYNVPTTLLAMIDAALGGKVAVDLMPYKNHLGFASRFYVNFATKRNCEWLCGNAQTCVDFR
jgi:3-dehydroquinate synthetase